MARPSRVQVMPYSLSRPRIRRFISPCWTGKWRARSPRPPLAMSLHTAPWVRRQPDSAADAGLQRRVWQGQRVAWGLMTVVVVAGFLGLLGAGPLGRRSIVTPDGAVRVEYERFL